MEIDKGTYIDPIKTTVKEWMLTWVKNYIVDVKASTAYLYKNCAEKYIIPNLGAVRLQELKAPMIQSFYNTLWKPKKEGVNPLCPKTIRNVHGVLHKALQQAVLLGLIRYNPSDACKTPKVIHKEIKPLDEEQIRDFMQALDGKPHEYLYKIALFTGMRKSEILGLAWDSVDFENSTVTVCQQLRREQKKGGKYYFSPPKSNKTRVLVVPPSVLRLFRCQRRQQNEKRLLAGPDWQDTGLVFTNDTGGYLSGQTVYDCFKRVVTEIGCPNTRFHDLRHTYAVMAIKAGDDIKTVQENLGHATAAFTLDYYAHVTNSMRHESANRMEETMQEYLAV